MKEQKIYLALGLALVGIGLFYAGKSSERRATPDDPIPFNPAASISTPAPAQDANAEANADPDKVQYLFLQTAHGVTSDGNTIVLTNVNPATLFLSDRPERIAGHGTTQEFVDIWGEGEDSFLHDNPNAVLSILDQPGGEVEDVVVVLSNPVYNGSDLTYTVEVLDGILPTSGGSCALFIDVIGRPLTPLSVAGVARRTTRRTVRRTIR